MADRTVVYRLRVEAQQFQAQMAAAAASTRKAAGEMGTSLKTSAGKGASALDDLGINAGTAAVAVGTAVVVASANFEKAMSGVQAATHESAAGMESLRDAALEAGAQTSFSATEAAAGIENLAKAGLSTDDILSGGLAGSLDLAAAGSMEVAEAAEAAAGALAQFKLEGDQTVHVADLLAAGAGKAQGDVSDMVQALKQAGTVSAQTGLSLEETVGTLSAMAEQSLLGSDAGTSFKTMLAALTPNSKKAADAMALYNINAFDAQGNFVGMTELAGQLQAGLSGLTDEQRAMALETIFGSDAVRAASIVYDNGAEGIANWTSQVDDAGYAAETAAIQLDNLAGDVEALKGALETAFIEGGDDSQGMLRGLTQLATDTVNVTTEAEKADGALGGIRDSAMAAINPLGSLGSMYNGLKGEFSDTDEKAKDLDESTKALTSTSTAAAGGLDAQANSAEGLAATLRLSAEETKAQEEAFQDARDAAAEVAGEFVNLGEDVDKAKVSLGDWIKQMSNQADALNNFMNNAKAASKRGLRDGLIRDLQDAGPAGALRMKQLANATDDEIGRANRAWKRGQDAMREYVNFKVPPKKIEVDTTKVLTAIQIIRNALKNIPDESVTVRVTRSGTGAVSPGFGPQANAEGGFITGPGTATSDSIPSYLSNGEYVVKAAAVDKYGVHMFDRLNAMHFATGGSVSKKGDKRKPQGGLFAADNTSALQDAIDRLTMVSEDQTRALDDATAKQEFWASKMSDLAEATVAGFNTSLFEMREIAGDSNVWASGASGPRTEGGWLENLTKDVAGLQERSGLQSQLAALGLSGDALSALLSEGTNSDISALINSGQVSQYADLYNQRAALQGSVGAAAGQQAFGAEMAAATREQRAATEIARQSQQQLTIMTNRLEYANELLARIPDSFAGAISGPATKASQSSPPKKNGGKPR